MYTTGTINGKNNNTTSMYSSPLQLIEKAHSYTEDDDLLSPFDTGEVERQIKQAWWKTCSLFTFLLATIGIIMFIIIRDNNDASSNSNNKVTKKNNVASHGVTLPLRDDNGKPSVGSFTKALSDRATLHSLYEPAASECANSIINTMIESSELSNDSPTISQIENGYFDILDTFASLEMKSHASVKDFVERLSKFGYYSNILHKEFPLNSFQMNAKSDAMIFVISINWESIYGNRLPYVTQQIVTIPYNFEHCEITAVFVNSFEECFNGKCKEKDVTQSSVFSYLDNLASPRSI